MKKSSILFLIMSLFPFSVYANPLGEGWHLVFEDNFNGTTLNKTIWTPGWFGTGITGPSNSNETACYNSTQATVSGDDLHLELVSRQSSCKGGSYPFTGALISSNPHDGVAGHTGFEYTYGYIEFRVILPPEGGEIANWPAFWTDGQNWPTDGEDDIMEGLGGKACFHFHSPAGGPGNCASGQYTGGLHYFASDWEPGSVTYYYDDVKVGEITEGITSAPQYIIINNTTSSSNALAPATVIVAHVRVWQK